MSQDIHYRLQSQPLQGYYWSGGYREYYEDALTNFSKQYYESRNQDIIDGSVQELKLFDEMLHRPENCRSDAQKFLVYHYIFMNYKTNLYNIVMINDRLKSSIVLVEVKPGTRKYFLKKSQSHN